MWVDEGSLNMNKRRIFITSLVRSFNLQKHYASVKRLSYYCALVEFYDTLIIRQVRDMLVLWENY